MNPYKVLQVDRDAEPEVIEAAYKRLAGKYHPDKNPSESATARMQEINAAYEILRDPVRRGQYDRERDERSRRRREQERPSEPMLHVPPVRSADEVSNRVVVKLLWIGGLIVLAIYLPWLAAIGGVLGAVVWLVRKYPGPTGTTIKISVAIAVAVAIKYWNDDRLKTETEKEEVRGLDLGVILTDQLDQYASSCKVSALGRDPVEVDAYCKCASDAARARFDMSPIQANSNSEYRSTVMTRFEAAVPGANELDACMQQAKPKPSAAAASTKKNKRTAAGKAGSGTVYIPPPNEWFQR